jgi:hypothetical protein
MVNPNTLWIMLHAKGRPPRAWINPSPLSLRAKKLNRISLLILQAKNKTFFNKITVSLKHNTRLGWKRTVEYWNTRSNPKTIREIKIS